MRRSRLLSLTLALVCGCALHQPPRASLLSDQAPPRGRQCSPASDPRELPDPSALIDDAAFRMNAARLWAAAGRPPGFVLLSLRHSPDGAQVRRAVIESTVPAAIADSLQKLAFVYRKEAPAAREEWGVRLRVDLGDPVTLRVGRREECVPRPRDWEYQTADNPYDVRERTPNQLDDALATDPGLVWVHVKLDERGYVTDATVEKSIRTLGGEERVLNYVRTLTFFPAMEDGYPVPAETSVPVRLSLLR